LTISRGRFPLDRQVRKPFGGRKTLDGVAQHRSWHSMRALIEKAAQAGTVSLGSLPKHPADRFMNEIMRVVEQEVRDLERVLYLTVPDEMMRRDDCDAALPERRRSGQCTQRRPTSLVQPATDDGRRRAVD